MPCIQYKDFNFRASTLLTIRRANEIIDAYREQGYDLTLRQLYYQFVARNYLPNTEKSYDNLGAVINDARLAGQIDWRAISDRTRYLRSRSHWNTPEEIVRSAADSFYMDRWAGQPTRVEVWIEKDALVGVLDGVCTDLDTPFFSMPRIHFSV